MSAAPLAATGSRAGLIRAVTAIGLVVLVYAALWPGTTSLIERWNDTVYRTYTHGWLIFGMVLWLLWRERSRLNAPAFLPAAAVLQLALGLAWLVSFRAGVQVVHWGLMPLLAATTLLTAFGWRATRPAGFALAYVYLAIPVWDALLPVLQWFSVLAVRFLLRLTGIPVYFSGNTFHLPAGTFEIADGCSGLHFFIVALAISLLHGELNRDRLRTRIALVALATTLAMITNWVRIYIIVLAGYATDMQHYLVATEHYSFGWYLFAGVIVIYFLITRRWPAPLAPPAGAAAGRERAVPAVSHSGVVVAALGVLFVPLWFSVDRNVASEAQLAAFEPRIPDGWRRSEDAAVDWQPRFVAADREQRLQFESGSARVETYTAVYGHQAQGKEVAGYGNSMLGEGWRVRATRLAVAGPGWSELTIENLAGETWLLWYANRLDDDWFASLTRMQLIYGLRSLVTAPAAGTLLVRARCAPDDCASARSLLARFTTAAWN